MGDGRVEKTKAKLKETMVRLLNDTPFEHITVTDLCREAGVSRITFYAYYDDKYELADELFLDMLGTVSADFEAIQQRSNPDNDPVSSYCNLLDAIFDLHDSNYDFFMHTSSETNPYLFFSYYWYVQRNTERFARKYLEVLRPKYELKMMTSFLCDGMWGFIRAAQAEHRPNSQTRAEAKKMLRGILEGELFTRSN